MYPTFTTSGLGIDRQRWVDTLEHKCISRALFPLAFPARFFMQLCGSDAARERTALVLNREPLAQFHRVLTLVSRKRVTAGPMPGISNRMAARSDPTSGRSEHPSPGGNRARQASPSTPRRENSVIFLRYSESCAGWLALPARGTSASPPTKPDLDSAMRHHRVDED